MISDDTKFFHTAHVHLFTRRRRMLEEWKFIFFKINKLVYFFFRQPLKHGNKVHFREMISQSDESLCPMHISLLSTNILFIIPFIHERTEMPVDKNIFTLSLFTANLYFVSRSPFMKAFVAETSVYQRWLEQMFC